MRRPASSEAAGLHGRFVELGFDLLLEYGYGGTRISDVVEAVGVAKGTFYLYFPSKRELLLACLAHIGEKVQEREALIGIPPEDPVSRITARVVTSLEQPFRWDKLPGFLLRLSTWTDDKEMSEATSQAWATLLEPWKVDLQQAIAQGAAREVRGDIELTLWGLTGLTEHLGWRGDFDATYDTSALTAAAGELVRRVLQSGSSHGLDVSTREGLGALLVDRSGLRLQLQHVAFNGSSQIVGQVGLGRVVVDPRRVREIALSVDGDRCAAEFCLNDGTTATLTLDGDSKVTGVSNLGSVSFSLRDVAALTFAAPGREDEAVISSDGGSS